MTGEKSAKKNRDPIFMVCLAIFLIAAVVVVGIFINNEYLATGDEKASNGDTVSVNYTGTFYDEYGGEYAVVFDTSFSSVANDDDIAKSNDFTTKSSYSPLSFTIGNDTMLEMFEDSVIGHKVGDKYDIFIPASQAYVGTISEGKLNESGNIMATTTVMTYDAFHTAYPDVEIKGAKGTVSFESKFKWQANAMMTDNGKSVIVMYMPETTSYTVYEKGDTKVVYTVTSVANDQIKYDINVQNAVVVNDDGDIQMIKLDLGEKVIYLTNKTGSEFTYKEGAERVNADLYFHIEVVSIN